MGPVLQLERDLGAVCVLSQLELAVSVHLSIEALPANVCGDGDFDGQRPAEEVEEVGAMDCAAMQAAVPGRADAGVTVAGLGRRLFECDVYGPGKSAKPVGCFSEELTRGCARGVGADSPPSSPALVPREQQDDLQRALPSTPPETSATLEK